MLRGLLDLIEWLLKNEYKSNDLGIKENSLALLGYGQYLCLSEVSVHDANGAYWHWAGGGWKGKASEDGNDPYTWHNEDDDIVVITLRGGKDGSIPAGKRFAQVILRFDLVRQWGFGWCYARIDRFELDVSDLVQKSKNMPNTVALKAYNTYKVAQADAVDIYDGYKLRSSFGGVVDCDGRKAGRSLIHFNPTHNDGYYSHLDQK